MKPNEKELTKIVEEYNIGGMKLFSEVPTAKPMKPNELRIGNLVLDDYSGVIELVNINSEYNCIDYKKPNFKAVGRMELQYTKPIPLTEELLLKLGFVKCETSEGHKLNGLIIYNGILTDCQKHKIQYVHQLQNLYFALTNEELTLNKL